MQCDCLTFVWISNAAAPVRSPSSVMCFRKCSGVGVSASVV